ncbi:hypothetical protein [Hyphomicrobium sp. DMF-1]|uniref:hypothetical protein n=1 Tax=Hyphomicrobium sp. DMF-1 TaxID=3019544 RepID=UPI0022EBB214|nr:hypothetical protein [Hyphomicrobium sp. DMF-1]WBT40128.1 hypothetical protein PE058_09670 [Hyphomicrobium sp. DMF-1]
MSKNDIDEMQRFLGALVRSGGHASRKFLPRSSNAQDRVRQLAKYLGWAKYSNGEWHITNAGRTAHLARTEGGQG